jgi:hypothetical protein
MSIDRFLKQRCLHPYKTACDIRSKIAAPASPATQPAIILPRRGGLVNRGGYQPSIPAAVTPDRLGTCTQSALKGSGRGGLLVYVSEGWLGIPHVYSYTGVSMTFRGAFPPLMRAWICSTVSGAKYCSPVSGQTRAGTCSMAFSAVHDSSGSSNSRDAANHCRPRRRQDAEAGAGMDGSGFPLDSLADSSRGFKQTPRSGRQALDAPLG